MTFQKDSRSRIASVALVVAFAAIVFVLAQGVFFYIYVRKSSQERYQLDFQKITIDQIKARRILIVDDNGNERIVLGMGLSEFNNAPNVSIKLMSPTAKNPIILSTTDEAASVSVSKRAFVAAKENGHASLHLHRDEYQQGAIPRMALVTDKGVDASRLVITDGAGKPAFVSTTSKGNTIFGVLDENGKPRTVSGINSQGIVFDEVYNNTGELIYAVQSHNNNLYPTTFIKQDPASRIWGGMSTFSTLKTFWDILTK